MTSPAAPPFVARRAVLGGLVGLATHVVVLLGTFLTYQLWPGKSGGLEDLGILATGLLVGEAAFGLACLILGTVWYRRGQRELGLGLVVGWVVGLLAACLVVRIAG